MKIAFIGLGVMGFPMARHLAAAGHELTVFNRSHAKAEAWITKHGGRSAATPAEAASGQDFVLTCVGNDADLRDVVLGTVGAASAMHPGAILIDHTTASKDIALELAAVAAAGGFCFMDAPVSGGQVGAETAALTVMCGGAEADFKAALPILRCFSKSVTRMGGVGSGQLAKMANQICNAGIVQSLAEALRFAQLAGLDMEKLVGAMSKGAAASWHLSNRAETMNEGKFDFGFAVDLVRKDLGLCLSEASRLGASLPATALIDQFFADLQRLGDGRLDMSSLIKRL